MKRKVEFDFDIGEKVKVYFLKGVMGTVISLWYSDRGSKYEVAYYVESERKIDYFYAWELLSASVESPVGFSGEEKKWQRQV